MPDHSERSWAGLVHRIQSGDSSATEELYYALQAGFRPCLCRKLEPEDGDDIVQDLFLTVYEAIQRSGLRDPERVFGFAKTVAHRKIAAQIQNRMRGRRRSGLPVEWLSDNCPNPEQISIARETRDVVGRTLHGLGKYDREILIRVLDGQTQDQICAGMGLTPPQFQVRKCRVTSRLRTRTQEVLNPRPQKHCGAPLQCA